MKDNLTSPQANILSVYHVRCNHIPYIMFVRMGYIHGRRADSSQHFNQLRIYFIKLKALQILRFLFNIVFTFSMRTLPVSLSLSIPFSLRLFFFVSHLKISIGTFAFIKFDMQSFIQPSLFWQPKLTKIWLGNQLANGSISHFPFPSSHFALPIFHSAFPCPICIIYLLIYLLLALLASSRGVAQAWAQLKVGRSWTETQTTRQKHKAQRQAQTRIIK